MNEEVKKLTPMGRIQKPAYNVIAQWVQRAWDDIDPTLIRHAFKCCGISNNRNSSEDRQIFDYNFLKVNSSTSYIFGEEENYENSNESVENHEGSSESVENHEGSSESDRNYEGSNKSIRSCDNDKNPGQSPENELILDFGDKNFNEHYNDLEVENYSNYWH
ncbi:710_t:CDS:1 [Cetraspora pellucida]|uniref:710_t:CDS:1 n=1 Tax=Cetraspora pellucida TaxID=1433469 RepID=A0A9N9J0M2_9GLOM|nr:710_t:CDS:1 [Cetraspora pellucida]